MLPIVYFPRALWRCDLCMFLCVCAAIEVRPRTLIPWLLGIYGRLWAQKIAQQVGREHAKGQATRAGAEFSESQVGEQTTKSGELRRDSTGSTG